MDDGVESILCPFLYISVQNYTKNGCNQINGFPCLQKMSLCSFVNIHRASQWQYQLYVRRTAPMGT